MPLVHEELLKRGYITSKQGSVETEELKSIKENQHCIDGDTEA